MKDYGNFYPFIHFYYLLNLLGSQFNKTAPNRSHLGGYQAQRLEINKIMGEFGASSQGKAQISVIDYFNNHDLTG